MASKNLTIGKSFLTPKFRVSFPSVFEPESFQDQESFALTMLFEPDEDISILKKMAMEVAVARWGREAIPKGIPSPFHDGNEKEYDGYKGKIYVKAANRVYNNAPHKARPGVVDSDLTVILSEEEFYAGCYARAKIFAKASGGPGTTYSPRISFGIQNIQKLAEGEPFGGTRPAAENDFEAVMDDSDNPENYSDAPGPKGDAENMFSGGKKKSDDFFGAGSADTGKEEPLF